METQVAEHTPGPWEYIPNGTEPTRIFIRHDVRGGEYVAEISVDGDLSNAFANARLIAQSPMMYTYIERQAHRGDAEAQRIMEAVDAATNNTKAGTS